VFFLDGGGACYDATTCAFLPEDPAYDWNAQGDDPSQPVYGGLVADRLPDAEVTVFGGQSGHVPDDPDRNVRFLDRWGVYDTMPDWEGRRGAHRPRLAPPAVLDPGRPPRPRVRAGPLRLRPTFYELEVEGVRLVDWVDAPGTWQP
jgi:hypothetical protein